MAEPASILAIKDMHGKPRGWKCSRSVSRSCPPARERPDRISTERFAPDHSQLPDVSAEVAKLKPLTRGAPSTCPTRRLPRTKRRRHSPGQPRARMRPEAEEFRSPTVSQPCT